MEKFGRTFVMSIFQQLSTWLIPPRFIVQWLKYINILPNHFPYIFFKSDVGWTLIEIKCIIIGLMRSHSTVLQNYLIWKETFLSVFFGYSSVILKGGEVCIRGKVRMKRGFKMWIQRFWHSNSNVG